MQSLPFNRAMASYVPMGEMSTNCSISGIISMAAKAIRLLRVDGHQWINLDDHTGKASALWGANGIPVIAVLDTNG